MESDQHLPVLSNFHNKCHTQLVLADKIRRRKRHIIENDKEIKLANAVCVDHLKKNNLAEEFDDKSTEFCLAMTAERSHVAYERVVDALSRRAETRNTNA